MKVLMNLLFIFIGTDAFGDSWESIYKALLATKKVSKNAANAAMDLTLSPEKAKEYKFAPGKQCVEADLPNLEKVIGIAAPESCYGKIKKSTAQTKKLDEVIRDSLMDQAYRAKGQKLKCMAETLQTFSATTDGFPFFYKDPTALMGFSRAPYSPKIHLRSTPFGSGKSR